MSRAIKFRAWNAKTREMLEVREAVFINGELADYHAVGDHAISGWRGNDVIMQYTGRHDKNGDEVYEGDLLSNGLFFCGEVIFDDGAFVAEDRLGCYINRRAHGRRNDFSELKVIGNIYENPELLKEHSHG